jgi:nitrogen fixation protein FixH
MGRPKGPAKVQNAFTLSGRHVLVALLVFFAVVASVNGLMMRLAISSMPGLDARNGYDVSQRYNAEIKAATAQQGRGWQVTAQVGKRAYGAWVAADFASPSLAPLGGMTVSATLEHPATRQMDRSLALKETTPGHYEALAPGLPGGVWTLVLKVEQPGQEHPVFVSRNRIQVER